MQPARRSCTRATSAARTPTGLGHRRRHERERLVVGVTLASDFPTTAGALARARGGSWDAFGTKMNASGSTLAYSTFLGGASEDFGFGVAVDSTRNAYVTGQTGSSDFPITAGAYDTTFNNGDAFVTKLNLNQCSDGRDNDGDSKVDFPADPGCSTASDDDESNPPPVPTSKDQCKNGGWRDTAPPSTTRATASASSTTRPGRNAASSARQTACRRSGPGTETDSCGTCHAHLRSAEEQRLAVPPGPPPLIEALRWSVRAGVRYAVEVYRCRWARAAGPRRWGLPPRRPSAAHVHEEAARHPAALRARRKRACHRSSHGNIGRDTMATG